MKLNFDYYKNEDDNKIIGQEYENILEKIVKCDDEDYSKTLKVNDSIKDILALSEIRENILNWYKFKENCKILELNANYGELTGLLCQKANNIISIESSKRCAELIAKRYEQKENIEVIVADYKKVEFQEKFDYIVIVGIVENLENEIEYAKKYIRNDGKIIIAVNNKYGMKAWTTVREEENIINNSKNTISKKKLDRILNGLKYRYYFPLPNYYMPNIIYSENSMPNVENIYRDITYKDREVNFRETEGYRSIIEDDSSVFVNYANSFLIEASMSDLETNKIEFVTFSNMKKDEYRIKTIVEKDFVYKTAVNYKANDHINNIKKNIDLMNNIGIMNLDKYENNTIISKFCTENKLEDKMLSLYINEGLDCLTEEIIKYKKYLIEKLEKIENINENVFDKYNVKYDENIINDLTFVKHGFWDLIFQNCFVINNQYYFFDQEWYEENIPVEYIIYRAIIYFNTIKKYESNETLLEKVGILKYYNIFLELDNKIQEKIRKPLMWNIHSTEEVTGEKINKLNKKLDMHEKIIQEKDKEIIEYKNEISNLKNRINNLDSENKINNDKMLQLQNSMSWKITKPLRKINEIIRRKK